MPILTFILLFLFHFLTGFSVISLFKIKHPFWASLFLSEIVGIGVQSFLPLILMFAKIPLSATNMFGINIIFTLLFLALGYKQIIASVSSWDFKGMYQQIKLYEIPFICILGYILLIAVWRSFYVPSYSRDFLSGPEAIADYITKEHTYTNSLFKQNLETTNNQFKSSFIPLLQAMYKYAGLYFGGLWNGFLAISFFGWLYTRLRLITHPILAGLFLLFLVSIPEMYGYMFMVLYDFPNAVFLTVGIYYVAKYILDNQSGINNFYFGSMVLSISVYVRSETFLFIALLSILFILFWGLKNLKKMIVPMGSLLLISFIGYAVFYLFYMNHYFPVKYDIAGSANKNIFDLGPLFDRMGTIFSTLTIDNEDSNYALSSMLYGHIIHFFFLMLLIHVIFLFVSKKNIKNPSTNFWLFSIFVMYFGLSIVGFILPLMDINNTTKRAMFKLFPLMIFYFAYHPLSVMITKWLSFNKEN
jgi:hypothetical protein